jgi:hypothetical protein
VTEALLSTAVGVLLAAVGLAGLLLLTVAPCVVAVELAERRRLGSARWGAAAAVCSAVGLGCAAVAVRHGLGTVPAALGALATWTVPLALLVLGADGGRLAGRRGRHE